MRVSQIRAYPAALLVLTSFFYGCTVDRSTDAQTNAEEISIPLPPTVETALPTQAARPNVDRDTATEFELVGINADASGTGELAKNRPNVIWILFDALRAHNLSCYGYLRETSPNIDALARNGTVFEQNFSQGFWTRVSMSSMTTGRYFASVIDNYPRRMNTFKPPGEGEKLMAEVFRENGYSTTLITAHAAFPPGSVFSSSFDECVYLRSPKTLKSGYDDFEAINQAVRKLLENSPSEPFFFFIHTVDTHFPHYLEPPFNKWIDEDFASPQFDSAAGQPIAPSGLTFTEMDREHLTGLYDGSISYADHHFGQLTTLLRETGLLATCILVVSSDHGDLLAEDGATWGHPEETYDLLMHVPLVMAGPRVPRGRRVAALTENADILPTLIDILGLDTQAKTDGVSLRPAWEDPAGPPVHDYVFAKLYGINDAHPVYVLRDHEYKLEYDPIRGIERLWALPEDGQSRADVKDSSQSALRRMKDYVKTNLIPLWEDYAARPDMAIRVKMSENLDKIVNKEAVFIPKVGHQISPEWHRDDKWLLYDEKLWTALWLEQAPPLSISIPVPNGEYLVQIRLLASEDIDGHPASKIKVLVQDDIHYKYIREAKPSNNHHLLFGEAGLYAVTDGTLRLQIATSNTEDWAIFDEIRLVPSTWHTRETEDELNQRLEQLKALGYL